MKKLFILPVTAILGLLFFQAAPKTESDFSHLSESPALPADVKAIVQQKCYGCHNAESKNEKGKAKLDWNALEASKKSKSKETMGKISEVLKEGTMPPAKFLENKPEGKLTEMELATLMEWSAGKKKSKK